MPTAKSAPVSEPLGTHSHLCRSTFPSARVQLAWTSVCSPSLCGVWGLFRMRGDLCAANAGTLDLLDIPDIMPPLDLSKRALH
eukprot:6100144-Amphidinium_carterae.3